jgi:hypothetical protein
MVNVLFLLKPDRLEAIFLFLGLPMRPMGGASVVMNDRVLGNLDDIREQLGPATYRPFLQFDRLAKDRMTPLEFYYSDHPEDTFNWDVLTFVGTALILLDG